MSSHNVDNTYFGTIVTILSGWIGYVNPDQDAKLIFLGTSIISCIISSVYTYLKIIRLKEKDENNLDKF